MRTVYDKLVRDRIPEIIAQAGRQCGTEVYPEPLFHEALRAKLIEEAQEVAAAAPEQVLAELADLSEVLDALLIAYGIERSALLAEQDRRRDTRGGFSQRLRLRWTE